MKPHINIPSRMNRKFAYNRQPPRRIATPVSSYEKHANRVGREITKVAKFLKYLERQPGATIETPPAVSIRLYSRKGEEFPVTQLDGAQGFQFQSSVYDEENDRHIVTVSVTEAALTGRFGIESKLARFLERKGELGSSEPTIFINALDKIEFAEIQDFWVGDAEDFPADPDKQVWWEMWLRRIFTRVNKPTIEPRDVLENVAEQSRGAIAVSKHSIRLSSSQIFHVKASVNELTRATELIPLLTQLRKPVEPTERFTGLLPNDQRELSHDLHERLKIDRTTGAYAVLLDAGVNYRKQILNKVISIADSVSWEKDWGPYTPIAHSHPTSGGNIAHATSLAGVLLFPDFKAALLGADEIVVQFGLESGRILPPTGANEPHLYGAITAATVSELEANNPQRKRVFSLAVTAPAVGGYAPSSWSSAIDNLAISVDEPDASRLFIISTGNSDFNAFDKNTHSPWELAANHALQDPAQAWNAISVGAYTRLDKKPEGLGENATTVSKYGEVYAASCSSVAWERIPGTPIKPEVVEEGGNLLKYANDPDVPYDINENLRLLTTAHSDNHEFTTTGETSAAATLVARLATEIRARCSKLWPETVRALLVHSAEWTPAMKKYYQELCAVMSEQEARERVLRIVGYGVPNRQVALGSTENTVTMISQSTLRPFTKEGRVPSQDATFEEMIFHDLPITARVLEGLPRDLDAELKVTLSYFIEPNSFRSPLGRWASYPSYGLRFDFMRPGEDETHLFSRIRGEMDADDEEYRARHPGWYYPRVSRTRGSIHLDAWRGQVHELLSLNKLVVYPVGGWWKYKYRYARDRAESRVRYSIVATLKIDDPSIDIYSSILQEVQPQVETPVDVEID